MWCLGHGCRVTDRFSRGAAPDDHVRGCSCWVMGRFSQGTARNGGVGGRNRRATGRRSRDMAYDSRGLGRYPSGNGTALAGYGFRSWGLGHDCRAMGWFLQDTARNSRGWGRNRWVTDRFSQAKAHSITWRTIMAARSKSFSTYKQKVVSNHKGSIPPHSCRPAHRPVRLTDDRSSSAPRQS